MRAPPPVAHTSQVSLSLLTSDSALLVRIATRRNPLSVSAFIAGLNLPVARAWAAPPASAPIWRGWPARSARPCFHTVATPFGPAPPQAAGRAQGHGAVCERARAPGPHRQPPRRPGEPGVHAALPAQGPPALAGLPGARAHALMTRLLACALVARGGLDVQAGWYGMGRSCGHVMCNRSRYYVCCVLCMLKV